MTPRTRIFLVLAVLSACALVAVGCAADVTDSADMRIQLRVRSFVVAENSHPPFDSDGNPEAGHLYFDAGSVMWQHSDVCLTLADSYHVDVEGRIVAFHDGNRIKGRFHMDSGRLEWDGYWFEESP
jgi:hypothetical protein